MGKHTIDIRPAASYVRQCIEHCDLPIVYNDDHTAYVTGDQAAFLSTAISLAMLKQVNDTMILPSNANAVRDVSRQIKQRVITDLPHDLRDDFAELAERLDDIANNLDTRKDG